MTRYHAQYYAHYISLLQPNWWPERIWESLLNATIDLNPHQVYGALFYFQKSPISDWVILADEVWLGKTIEAWLILCQMNSELKKKILLIVPASLRKQRKNELEEKFFLPSIILDNQTYKQFKKDWIQNPFDQDQIIITSYEFGAKHGNDIIAMQPHLVVIDEAHKLRSAYKDKEWRATLLRKVLKDFKKILLTATPLQNSLLELYWLVSFIDEYTFGDIGSFKAQFSHPDRYRLADLRKRLEPLVNRTLRQQVKEYINYTNRISQTYKFIPNDKEVELYEKLSGFLQRESLQSIQSKTKHLVILIIRKLLASSSHAIAWTLTTIIDRLEWQLSFEDLVEEKDLLDVYEENIDDVEEQNELNSDLQKLQKEINELIYLRDLAMSIQTDTKTYKLVTALEEWLKSIEEKWWLRKWLIFTESRRTQDYLKKHLTELWYNVVIFNWSNSSPETKKIYQDRLQRHQWSSKISWSKEADTRASLVEYFRDHADIMIATESASEWVNLQFCSLLINYDLPWNPQRIEQRIWRCHRYGQKCDVTIVNFLNANNHADMRVLELLEQKLELFDWVFWFSDEVLWYIADDIDFEQSFLKIYQQCRTVEEIDNEFKIIQEKCEAIIKKWKEEAKNLVIQNFDEEVQRRLKNLEKEWVSSLKIYERYFWRLTKRILADYAQFDLDSDTTLDFVLHTAPQWLNISAPTHYTMNKKDIEFKTFHRPNSPLWQRIINSAKKLELEPHAINLCFSCEESPIWALKDLKWQSWRLKVDKLIIESFEKEEYLIVTAVWDNGQTIPLEASNHFFRLDWTENGDIAIPQTVLDQLQSISRSHIDQRIEDRMTYNANIFHNQLNKLDAREEDKRQSLHQEINEIKQLINEKRKEWLKETDRDRKVHLRWEATKLSNQLATMEQSYFSDLKELENQKRQLITELDQKMQAKTLSDHLFSIRWTIT
jgi:ERCC4-related helicase